MVDKPDNPRRILEWHCRQHTERTRRSNNGAMRVIPQSLAGVTLLGNADNAAQTVLGEKRYLYWLGRSADSIWI